MKNNVDFIYEYSDLNFLQTRVKLLTGKYKDMVLEFGGSYVCSHGDVNDFTFDYAIYKCPENQKLRKLKGNPKFEKYLSNLLIDIIICRRNDPDEKTKLDEATSYDGVQSSVIKLDDSFYPEHMKIKHNFTQTITGTSDF